LENTGKALPYAYIEGNNCIDLNGTTQYGEYPSSLDYGLAGNELRITGWVYISTNNSTIIGQGAVTNGGWILYFNSSRQMQTLLKQDGSGTNYRTVSGSFAFSLNQWYYIDVTLTTATLTIKYGDSPDNLNTDVGTPGTAAGTYGDDTSTPVNVGSRTGGSIFYDGQIAGLELYKNGVLVSSNPIAEGEGAVSYDVTGNGNDITWVNTPAWSTQDNFANNVANGFSLYEHASLDPIRVPYGSDGSPLSITAPSGYSKTSDNPSVLGHNDAESTFDYINISNNNNAVPESAFLDASFATVEFDEDWSTFDYAFYNETALANTKQGIFTTDITPLSSTAISYWGLPNNSGTGS
jgi:hypothetical protein